MSNSTHIEPHSHSALGAQVALAGPHVSVRAALNSYFIALLLGSFFSAFLFYLESDAVGIALFIFTWVAIPAFALTDRVRFDGRRLSRSGVVPRIWATISGTRRALRVNDVEQVETSAVRAAKRGENVVYRYRTIVRGKGAQIVFASGSDDYRRMIAALLPRLPEYVLDTRSLELRDHLADPKETLMKASFEQIPSADVLRNATRGIRTSSLAEQAGVGTAEEGRAQYLRELANELRLNGYLRQSLEAFRRALVIKPHDGHILFEFSRCVLSFAGAERSPRLERKAIAAMRLAERRAGGDTELLERIGEAYFMAGETSRARGAFLKALERVGEGFRSARGLAEIALREGKIAHVIHHFAAANRLAQTVSLRRWTGAEVEYFTRLNSDPEYMDMELGRVSMLETFERIKRTALRLTYFGFPVILLGILADDSVVADSGWALSSVGLLIWTSLSIGSRMFSSRIPYDAVQRSED